MVKKRYSTKLKKNLWGFDLRVRDGDGWRRIRTYVFDTRQQAEEALTIIRRREREEQFGLPPAISRPRLADLVTQRVASIELRSERVRAERVLQTLLELLPKGIRIDEITTPDLRKFVEKRQADGQANASISRELNIIVATLNGAAGFFPELAQWRPPKAPRPKVSKSRRERIISDEEYRRILSWLRRPPDADDATRRQNQQNAFRGRVRVAAILEFAMNTGMRPKEIYALRWTDVDWEGQQIRVHGTKTDAVRYVPMTSQIVAVLRAEQEHVAGRDFVFTKGGRPTPKIYRILREATEAVGIDYGRNVPDGLELYCARHTFTTRLLQAGLDLRTVGSITGHSDKELVLHYSHVTAESATWARSAMEQIGRRRSGEGDESSSGKIERFLAWAETAEAATALTAEAIEWIAAAADELRRRK